MQTEKITNIFKTITILGLLFITLGAEGRADENTAAENQLALLESKIAQLEDRVDELEAWRDDAELAAESGDEGGDRAAARQAAIADRAAQKDDEKNARVQKLLDDATTAIVLLNTKIEALPSGGPSHEDRIKHLKAKAKLYAEKERRLKKIKHLAQRNPQLNVDVSKIDSDIIITQAKKTSAYDEINRLTAAERKR